MLKQTVKSPFGVYMKLDKMCHGQECFLRIPFCCTNDSSTVVPAHSNQLKHGKGKGIKADADKTVPACFRCHYELDQGKRLTKQERRDYWDSAYERWVQVRSQILNL